MARCGVHLPRRPLHRARYGHVVNRFGERAAAATQSLHLHVFWIATALGAALFSASAVVRCADAIRFETRPYVLWRWRRRRASKFPKSRVNCRVPTPPNPNPRRLGKSAVPTHHRFTVLPPHPQSPIIAATRRSLIAPDPAGRSPSPRCSRLPFPDALRAAAAISLSLLVSDAAGVVGVAAAAADAPEICRGGGLAREAEVRTEICQQLTPTWEKAAGILKGIATVAVLDADTHKALAQVIVDIDKDGVQEMVIVQSAMSTPSCEASLTAANNIQPFFVLHKAAAASISSPTPSRARRRIDISQPSSPNPKSAKRSRDDDDDDDDEGDTELYEKLRLEAFHRTWSKIQSTINEVLRSINLKLFDQVLQWVQESFSVIRSIAKPCAVEIQQPYPLLTDVVCRKIPTAFVLTKNAEFVDDITTFRDLAEHLESNGCHLAKLSATELSAKHGVGGCFRSFLRQLLSDVPDVADISALASWYCGLENYDKPIIVIIDDLEQCSGDVLGELVMMLSEWVMKIPIFFVMGIATTLDGPRKLLSSEALQRLQPCKLNLGSPSDRMNALVEAILVKPCSGFCISHEVAVFLRNYFFRHDGTITSFIIALKLACSKHFSAEPLSFLCMGMLEEDCEDFWRDKFDALPQAMRKYVLGLPSCTRDKNSIKSGNNMVEGLSELMKLQKDLSSVLLCLYEAGRHGKVQLLDIFCEAVNPDLHTQKASNNDLLMSEVTSDNLSRGKSGSGRRFIAQAMDTMRYLPMETLFHVLKVWSIHLKGMNEINDKVKELQSTSVNADSVRITKDKWTRRSASTGNGRVPLNEKAAMLLDDVIRKFLVPVECLPFHEIICFKNVAVLQSALIGNPRRMVQLDLLKSQSRIKCSCCGRNGIAVSASLHDTSIMCNLAQEYGDVINLHDWYLSFDGIINSTNSKVKRKPHSSPSKRKSKATPPESEAMIQARFCRAVTELQITGLLRMPSKRRPDLVQRIAFGP